MSSAYFTYFNKYIEVMLQLTHHACQVMSQKPCNWPELFSNILESQNRLILANFISAFQYHSKQRTRCGTETFIGSVDTILIMTSPKRATYALGSSPDEPLSQSLHKPVVLVINNNYFAINNIRNYLFDFNNIIAA